uniref:G-protein coupled receptors family 1 profile domain-containing protein n=1 Tax=Lates calcarifer TaxID=8187 RepID=A0A4W6DTE9_LATCA
MNILTTKVSYFTLAAYFDTGLFKYLFFIISMSLYILILCANVLLIVIICMNRSLHEPMYLFLCSLFVNELYGSTGLFPSLMVQILSDIHTVSTSFCFLQIFCVHSYGTVELLLLTVMSYDRYAAICYPLLYNTCMSSCKIAIMIAAAWVYGFFVCFIMVCLSSSLQLCGNIINKVYCDNYSVVKMSCSDIQLLNIFGLISCFGVIICPLSLIFYSYMKILKVCFSVCFSGSKQTCFEMLQSRFNMNSVLNMLRIFLSLYFLTCQPLFNPVIYGLNLSKIRVTCKQIFNSYLTDESFHVTRSVEF